MRQNQSSAPEYPRPSPVSRSGRLYPANDVARPGGVLAASFVDGGTGHGAVTVASPDADLFAGEYTIVFGGVLNFGSTYGSGVRTAERRHVRWSRGQSVDTRRESGYGVRFRGQRDFSAKLLHRYCRNIEPGTKSAAEKDALRTRRSTAKREASLCLRRLANVPGSNFGKSDSPHR